MKSNTVKKIMLITGVVLVSLLFSSIAYARQYSGSCGSNVRYVLDDTTGILTISGDGEMNNYSNSTSMPWYSQKSKIKTVEVKDGVTSIGNRAFYGVSTITSISLPESMEEIGDYAFNGCSSLNDVIFPQSLTALGKRAFYGCRALSEILLPDDILYLEDKVFSNCTSLETVKLPNNLEEMSDSVFEGCSLLNSITIPANVQVFGEDMFMDCSEDININVYYNSPAVSFFSTQPYNYTVVCKVDIISDDEVISSNEYEYGYEFTFPPLPASKEGYDCLGFVLDSQTYSEGDKITIDNHKTITVPWKMKEYDICYILNGAEQTIEPQKKLYWEDIKLSDITPTREGYEFLGYATEPSSLVASYMPADTVTKNENLTLYAIWKEKTYTVKFDANGGEGTIPPQTKMHSTNLQITDLQPHRDGYTFRGWSSHPEGVLADVFPGGFYTENKDVTLYAIWKDGIIIGDANSDGDVTLEDLVLMMQRINNHNITLSNNALDAMDVNNDTYFNIKDVLKLAQYLAGWTNVVLGE